MKKNLLCTLLGYCATVLVAFVAIYLQKGKKKKSAGAVWKSCFFSFYQFYYTLCMCSSQVCGQLDWAPWGPVRKGQLVHPVWQVCPDPAGQHPVWQVQADHTGAGSEHDPDTVLPVGGSPHSRTHTPWHCQGCVWTVLCVCSYLGLWRIRIPGSSVCIQIIHSYITTYSVQSHMLSCTPSQIYHNHNNKSYGHLYTHTHSHISACTLWLSVQTHFILQALKVCLEIHAPLHTLIKHSHKP